MSTFFPSPPVAFAAVPATERVEVRFKACGSGFPLNGISNRYDDAFTDTLEGVLDVADFDDVVARLNRTLQDLWPCGPAYYCGICCAACTCGVSLLLPNVCVSEAEKHAAMLLANISARAKYYDRGVSFHLEKGSYFYVVPRSYFVVSYPKSIRKTPDVESGHKSRSPVNEEPSQYARLKST